MLSSNENELLLREDNQRESRDYLKKLEEIRAFKQRVIARQAAAKQEIPKLKKQLALLNAGYEREYYKTEGDPAQSEKLQEMEQEKLKLRFQIEDLESVIKTNIAAIINAKFLKDIEGYEDKASGEYISFTAEVGERRSYYLDLQKKIQNKLQQLSLIERRHAYARAEELKDEIRRLDYMQDGGWVDTRPDMKSTQTTTAIVGRDGELFVYETTAKTVGKLE